MPFWIAVTDARLLGTNTFAGHAALKVSFYDPKTPAWFLVELDERTLHTLDLHMITTAHFMHDTYTSFDAPIEIRPPSRSRVP